MAQQLQGSGKKITLVKKEVLRLIKSVPQEQLSLGYSTYIINGRSIFQRHMRGQFLFCFVFQMPLPPHSGPAEKKGILKPEELAQVSCNIHKL